jgi:hypothetical protein
VGGERERGREEERKRERKKEREREIGWEIEAKKGSRVN